ncbi:MAG TPA: glycosyltransferase family 39 protein [Bryobacteraceae bacterium]|nr:glycosyltransferase family 39 protein [Bryobacteraceae bacterium]
MLALLVAGTKAPWFDEGQYVNSSYNLAFHGDMGSNVLEPSGMLFNHYFRGIQRHTYYTVPVQLVTLAGWFRVVGFSIVSARMYSICWGIVTLFALFYVLRMSFQDRRIATIGTFFTAVDFVFLWSTADARMDSAANALSLCAVALYLHFRKTAYAKAVLYSQVLGAIAVFTHPNAILVILAMILLALRFDRKQLRELGWKNLSLAAAPYLCLAFAWSLYILQSPVDFHDQFFANAAGRNSERLTKLLHPDAAILSEIDRHLGVYCVGGVWGGVMKNWMILVPVLYMPAMIWLLIDSKRQEERASIFTNYTVAMILGLTFLNGFKGYFYLIYVLPLYSGVLAAWLLRLWSRSVTTKCVAVTFGAAILTMQLSISILHIHSDEYHHDYVPAVQELARDKALGRSIVGDAALGFGLDYGGFHDDVRLGMYSGLSPDVVVIDRAYRMYAGYYAIEEPAVFNHIVTLLTRDYRLEAQHGSFWIFTRVPAGQGTAIASTIDTGKSLSAEGENRARFFFRQIFTAWKMRDAEESSL